MGNKKIESMVTMSPPIKDRFQSFALKNRKVFPSFKYAHDEAAQFLMKNYKQYLDSKK